MKARFLAIFLMLFLGQNAIASELIEGDVHVNGYPSLQQILQQKIKIDPPAPQYTWINMDAYRQIFDLTRQEITKLLNVKKTNNLNDDVAQIANELNGVPYLDTGAMGEGDWLPNATLYVPGALHVQQDPVYRIDGLNCQTYVQMVLGILNSKNLDQFDQNYLKISYGAAGNNLVDIVHYFNRDNFVSADLNPLNEKNGYLQDVTTQGVLAPYSASVSANITRQNWFNFQMKNLTDNIRVFTSDIAVAMDQRFNTFYSDLNFPNFDSQIVSLSYVPKEKLALAQPDGSFKPNQALLDLIPTPSVVEIVRDAKKWNIGGKNIKDLIGTELNVSHLGILYRKTFKENETIYQKISCSYDAQHNKVCNVTPVKCTEKQCNVLMLSHATSSHPNDYYYWMDPISNNYQCTAQPPKEISWGSCNRVEQIPLFDYLTDYQYGSYWYMNSPSIVGIHVEKIL